MSTFSVDTMAVFKDDLAGLGVHLLNRSTRDFGKGGAAP
jgi:hypothetical protein